MGRKPLQARSSTRSIPFTGRPGQAASAGAQDGDSEVEAASEASEGPWSRHLWRQSAGRCCVRYAVFFFLERTASLSLRPGHDRDERTTQGSARTRA